MRLRLINNWTKVWKMWSTWMIMFMSVLPIVWAELPSDLKDHIPIEWRLVIFVVLGVIGVILRMIRQDNLHKDDKNGLASEPDAGD